MKETNKSQRVTKKLQPIKGPSQAQKGNPGRKKTSPRRPRNKAKQIRIGLLPVIAVFAAIAGLVLLPYIRSGRLAERGARVPKDYKRYCIDLSHHNGGPIAWDSLKVAVDRKRRTTKDLLEAKQILPVSGIYIKATEGVSLQDRRFAENWREAGRARTRRGAYHFFRSSADPLRQANHFIHTVGPLRHTDLPPVLDIETMHKGCTRDELNAAALAWLKAVEKHYGRRPVVYAPDSYVKDILSPEITGHYPLWIARYGGKKPKRSGFCMWQFTDKAVIHGIRGYVDLSVIPGDFPDAAGQ